MPTPRRGRPNGRRTRPRSPRSRRPLGDALAREGQILELMVLTATRAEVRIRNTRYLQQSQAIGRTARLMTRALPATVETLVITSSADGLPTSSVTVRRSDIERLENTEVGQIAASHRPFGRRAPAGRSGADRGRLPALPLARLALSRHRHLRPRRAPALRNRRRGPRQLRVAAGPYRDRRASASAPSAIWSSAAPASRTSRHLRRDRPLRPGRALHAG